ncbi:MAG: hypothetical protein FJ087_14265, partial [Deltaproteobacteria bacterium]|nr:hypothetical protein [Deltaproteobacteria bacterium]
MKVDCLRLSFKESGVAAYVRTRSDVPLRRLAAAAIAAIESVRLDAAALGAPEASMDAGGRLDLTRLHLRGMPAADLGREGILVAQTVAQGIAYIYDRWDPSGDGEPDETLRDVRARRVPRHARLKELEDLLLRRGDTDGDPFSSSRRKRRYRRPRFVWPREAFESGFEAVRAAGGRSAFLPALERGFP